MRIKLWVKAGIDRGRIMGRGKDRRPGTDRCMARRGLGQDQVKKQGYEIRQDYERKQGLKGQAKDCRQAGIAG